MSSENSVKVGSVELCYERFGSERDPAIILIMGLGMQMISWPDDFCRMLSEQGFQVIRFDNRDTGKSTKFHNQMPPGPLTMMLKSRLGWSLRVPYQLSDMAEDTVGLMSALGIEQAHIVGASMGGMIAQLVAAQHPNWVLSLTSIMSTSGNRKLPQPSPKVLMLLARKPAANEAEYLEGALKTWKVISSPDYQPEKEALEHRLLRAYRRSYYPEGTRRHMAAVAACGSRVRQLKRIKAPTLVIHGKADVLVPVSGGIDTAKHIPNAKLELIEGMGHDFPAALFGHFVDLITSHIAEQSPAEQASVVA